MLKQDGQQICSVDDSIAKLDKMIENSRLKHRLEKVCELCGAYKTDPKIDCIQCWQDSVDAQEQEEIDQEQEEK